MTLIQYSLEVAICWSALYLIYICLLKRETFFGMNRSYLMSSLVIGLVIPLVRMIDWPWQDQVILAQPLEYISAGPAMIAVAIQPSGAIEQAHQWQLIDFVMLVYVLGVLFMVARLMKGIYSIYQLYASGVKTKTADYTLVKTNEYHLPFSFLHYVFFSEEMKLTEELEQIMKHELTHIKSRHSYDVFFLELLHILFWWNPLIYLYKKELRQVHEYLADAMVIEDTDKKIYGRILLGQSQSGIEIALTHQFFHSHLKQRITMMYKQQSKRPALVKYLLSLPVVLLLALMFSSYLNIEDNAQWKSVLDDQFEEYQKHPKYGARIVSILNRAGNMINDPELNRDKVSNYLLELADDYDIQLSIKNDSRLTYYSESLVYTYDFESQKKEIKYLTGIQRIQSPFGIDCSNAFRIDLNYHDYDILFHSKNYKDHFLIRNGRMYGNNGIVNPEKIQADVVYTCQSHEDENEIHIFTYDENTEDNSTDVLTNITSNQGSLGINYAPNFSGIMISQIMNPQLIDAGVQAGDVILKIDKQKVTDKNSLAASLKGKDVGQVINLTFSQKGALLSRSVKLMDIDERKYVWMNPFYVQLKELEDRYDHSISQVICEDKVYDIADVNVQLLQIQESHMGSLKYIESDQAKRKYGVDVSHGIALLQSDNFSLDEFSSAIKAAAEELESLDLNLASDHLESQSSIANYSHTLPLFPGCEELQESDEEYSNCTYRKLGKFIKDRIVIPEEAKLKGIQGQNVAKITVSEEGKISRVELLRSIGAGTDEATKSIFSQMNDEITWIPAMQNGKAIAFDLMVPVKFEIGDGVPFSDSYAVKHISSPTYPSIVINPNYGPIIWYNYYTKDKEEVIIELENDNGQVIDTYKYSPQTKEFGGHFRVDRTKGQKYFIKVTQGDYSDRQAAPVYQRAVIQKDQNNDGQSFNCKPGEDGYYFWSDKRAILKSCEGDIRDDDVASCTSENLSEYFSSRFTYPEAMIQEGF